MNSIGIDLGNTYTSVSAVNTLNGKPFSLLFDSEYKIETKVSMGSYELDNLIHGMQKDVCYYHSDNSKLSPDETLARFFTKIKKYAENEYFKGEDIGRVAIAYPSDMELFKQDIIQNAAKIAGFSYVELISESAAATAGGKNEGVVVFNLGASRFSVSYIKYNDKGEYFIHPTLSDYNCGGKELDRLLYDEWEKLTRRTHGCSLSEYEGCVNEDFEKHYCKKIKEDKLSKLMDLDINYSLTEGRDINLILPLKHWEELISPILSKAIDKTKQIISSVTDNEYPINRIKMVGGSCFIPLITKMLREITDIHIDTISKMDNSIANGAALYANRDNKLIRKDCFCTKCGNKINTLDKFCFNCGTKNIDYAG